MPYNRAILRSARKQLKGRAKLNSLDMGETVFIQPDAINDNPCARHLVAKVVDKSVNTESCWLHQFENGHMELFPCDLYKIILATVQQASPTPGVRITMYWSDIWSWNHNRGELVDKVGHVAIQRFLQIDHQGRFRFPPDWSIHEIKIREEVVFPLPRGAK